MVLARWLKLLPLVALTLGGVDRPFAQLLTVFLATSVFLLAQLKTLFQVLAVTPLGRGSAVAMILTVFVVLPVFLVLLFSVFVVARLFSACVVALLFLLVQFVDVIITAVALLVLFTLPWFLEILDVILTGFGLSLVAARWFRSVWRIWTSSSRSSLALSRRQRATSQWSTSRRCCWRSS